MTNWIKYARWEETQQQFERARSVYERAIDVDHRNIPVWLKYAEMEMRHKQINHARNIWDRAVTFLPQADQFWYKYTYMEEMLGNVPGARQVRISADSVQTELEGRIPGGKLLYTQIHNLMNRPLLIKGALNLALESVLHQCSQRKMVVSIPKQ